jgi:ubiquinone/menaquinone biosynthesis C-methylase UbiE
MMLEQTGARVRRAGVAERVELRAGSAAALPLPDGQVDQVSAVNTAAIWPDLDAGLREAARVLRPGGTVVIAWHSARSPNRVQRRLAQSDGWWQRVMEGMGGRFDEVTRHDVTHVSAAVGTKPRP